MTPRKKSGYLLLPATILLIAFSQLMIWTKVLEPLSNPRWFVKPDNTSNVSDFFQYYQAAQLVVSDKAHQVYSPEVQRDWTNALLSPAHTDKIFYNQQPPFLYPLLAPLSFLPATIAYPVWCIAQACFGLFGLFLVSRLGPLSVADRRWLLVGVVACVPAYICFWHGNTSFWLLGALSLYCYWMFSRKDYAAGTMLALSTFKPQYLFILLTPAIGMRRWKVLVALVVAESLLMGLAVATIGLDNVVGYPQALANAESNPAFIGVNPQEMISLRGIFAQFLSIKESLKLASSAMFVSLIPLTLMWYSVSKNPSVDRLRWAWGVTFVVAVLLSPHAHIFDFLLIGVAAALTLSTLSILDLKQFDLQNKIWALVLILFPFASWPAHFLLGYKISPMLFFFPVVSALSLLSILCLRSAMEPEKSAV